MVGDHNSPQKHVWHPIRAAISPDRRLRQNKLSNLIFDDYEAIVTNGCAAWNSLIADPNRIKPIGTRSWAATGQP